MSERGALAGLPARRPAGFAWLLAAEGVSNFGSMLSRLAIPWLATLGLHASALEMAALLVAQQVLGALAALVFGPWVDRSPARRVMLLADGLAAVLLALLAWGAARGGLTMPWLVLGAGLAGALATLFDMARSAWVARAVPVAELPRRNAQLAAVGSVSETLAFASGGWLFQWLGAVVALALDAASFIASALLLKRVQRDRDAGTGASATGAARGRVQRSTQPSAFPTTFRPTPHRAIHRARLAFGTWWRDTHQGWRAVAADRRLVALAALEALLGGAMAATGAVYMIYVTRELGFGAGVLGLIFATGGLGALAGAMLTPRLGAWLGSGGAMVLGLAGVMLGGLALVLAPGAGWLGVLCLLVQQVLGDACHVVQDVHGRSLRQALPPAALVARVDGGLRGVGQLAMLLGALAGGAVATLLGARAALAMCVVLAALAALLALSRLRAVRLPEPVSAAPAAP